ncbi:transporter substrate-binding domain-containing protein [Heyndrickxia oleronia]|uniref:Amino acid ABC transporter substrate-binding protein n=1 Tax=Heyndrickxia oleronia TaxID=38875 RepID=A0A8E2LET8_9BACI|nr:transporter substrate-binding domain-containing protein [Heyndrickxia oleronia]NYV66828.1 transporter substrate-binding domain-containing protein [Bacillus sp. Gen3]MBU5212226.1 transporter substrate-binding domain-containing protein [Heyndrickxia oleronia]MCM3454605.1 transporter substrate-binding domain-containing protein [Heyndrickxia oleronia]MEC1375182.1 transporter substrate-binding domain-containing protein [Heyndrickxia oleronia]OOP68092.1 amino acid ABC transporter substrate-bindin
MNKRNPFKHLFMFVLVLALVVVTAACGNGDSTKEKKENSSWDKIKKEGKITVATSGTLYPTSFHESKTDKLTGFEVEVVREMAKRMDLKVDFKEMAFDGMLTSLNSGKVDIAANDINKTNDPSRNKKFAFSTPYKFSYATAIVRKDDLSGIKTVDDIKGKKAAGEATTNYMKIAKKFGAEEVVYDNATNEQYLRDVSAGRTDIIINDYYLQKLAIAAFPDLNITIHPDLQFETGEKGTSIVMKKANSNELKKHIDQTIQEMLDDGTIAKLSKQFFDGADVTKQPEVELK